MYKQLMNNLPFIKLKNGQLGQITHHTANLEEMKPFLTFTPAETNTQYLCFVYQKTLFVTMFRSLNPGIISRLRTVIDLLDQQLKPVDLPLYLVRCGIPLKIMTFGEEEAILTEMDLWSAQTYHFIAGARIEKLVRDLRDLLYI